MHVFYDYLFFHICLTCASKFSLLSNLIPGRFVYLLFPMLLTIVTFFYSAYLSVGDIFQGMVSFDLI